MRYVLSAAALAVIIAFVWLWSVGGLTQISIWAAEQQREFQNLIARALRGARAGEAGAVLALLGACFAYGLAHAAGPGHGKVLLGGYGFARKVPMMRLSVIALLASLGQAVTAVAMVYVAIAVLGFGRAQIIDSNDTSFANLSYGLIALIGLWLLWRGARKLLGRQGPDHHHHHDHAHEGEGAVCSTCGHAHGPTLEQVDQVGSLREALALVFAIAIRPCTGALFVLVITWQLGLAGLGIAGAFAMAAGTGLVTILVGLAASGLRGGVLAGFTDSPQMARVMAVLEAAAGAAVVLIAGGLLLRSVPL